MATEIFDHNAALRGEQNDSFLADEIKAVAAEAVALQAEWKSLKKDEPVEPEGYGPELFALCEKFAKRPIESLAGAEKANVIKLGQLALLAKEYQVKLTTHGDKLKALSAKQAALLERQKALHGALLAKSEFEEKSLDDQMVKVANDIGGLIAYATATTGSLGQDFSFVGKLAGDVRACKTFAERKGIFRIFSASLKGAKYPAR
ncbi:MAG TPA: hypothetical protein VIS96_10950 [Terrimicrobiaceae bacterium]